MNDFENQKRIALTTEYTDLVLVDNITDKEIAWNQWSCHFTICMVKTR